MKALEGHSDSPFIAHLHSFLCLRFIFMCLQTYVLCSPCHRANHDYQPHEQGLIPSFSVSHHSFYFSMTQLQILREGTLISPKWVGCAPPSSPKIHGQGTEMLHSTWSRASALWIWGGKGRLFWMDRHSIDVTCTESAPNTVVGVLDLELRDFKPDLDSALDSLFDPGNVNSPQPSVSLFFPALSANKNCNYI